MASEPDWTGNPDPSAIHLGRYGNQEFPDKQQPLPYPGERHLILFGPNGSGKGTRLLVPNLLSITGRSIVVIDPKGELASITAAYRRTVSNVVILNPFKVLDLPCDGFNPLAALDPDAPAFFEDVSGIAEALIKIEEHDPHWSESARGLLMAVVMWEVKEARREKRAPLLENVRRIFTEPDEKVDGRFVGGFRRTVLQMMDEGGFEIASLIGRFMRDNEEIASILSTADRQTWWILSKQMRENLRKNDLDFADLKKRPTTVYVVLPAERIRTHSVWLRLVIVSALRALYKPGGLRTLFMLDEFAQLQHLAPVEDAFGLVRGYGVQLWPILQDLNQLKDIYKERWESFIANAGIVQGFAPNDLTTADWMSRRAFDTTAIVAGYNTGDSTSERGSNKSHGMNYTQVKQPRFAPQNLMEFMPGAGLIFPASVWKSIPFYAPPYWKIPAIRDRAQPNPYFGP